MSAPKVQFLLAVVCLWLLVVAVCQARPEGTAQTIVDSPETAATAATVAAATAAADSVPAPANLIQSLASVHPDDVQLIGVAPALTATATATAFVPRNLAENSAEFWRQGAQATLRRHLAVQPNRRQARNVIFFMGDGMSLPTVTAARMYRGQQLGAAGEEGQLYFERFPHVGLSKTYCVNKQTADSACSATAYLCGVKANYGTIGLTAAVQRDNCTASLATANHVHSLLAWSQAAGKRTGIVTTTRITHASPAGSYAHTANRDWESDATLPVEAAADGCADIAAQLIRGETGAGLNVIFGGGRSQFLPANWTDADGVEGVRLDGVDLTAEWLAEADESGKRSYLRTRADLLKLSGDAVGDEDAVLGLFSADHMSYYLDADHEREPSLPEMVMAAIRRLQGSAEGYVLFVEGGRIDHAHHENRAHKALEETVQFAEAIRQAVELTATPDGETLVVVTADHAHTMSISGYSQRGDDVLGLNTGDLPADGLRYTTLTYGTGPRMAVEGNGSRTDLQGEEVTGKDYVYPALVPMKSAAHGGDDVGVFALGPWAHLFGGVYEQNAIPHLIGYAACVGEGLKMCDGQ